MSLQVRLVPVSQAGAGAWPVYVSNDAGAMLVVQRQSNPGAVPVYVGERGNGAMPVNFGGVIPDIPVVPPAAVYYLTDETGNQLTDESGNFLTNEESGPVGTSTYLQPGGAFGYRRPDGVSLYLQP